MAKNLPREFGPYTLHELIARGGMAEVYRATMPGIGGFEKPVAIKMILPHLAENEDFITMLIDEARIIVSVSHANIAQVYDLGRIEDNYYIAMEFIHGIDLAGLLKSLDEADVRIPIEHAVYVASCVCAGLHVAHSKVDEDGRPSNIVHRDVSPHNVLLSYAGEVKIIDFGVAKARNKEAHTKAGVIKGKLLYMAPEQAMAEGLDGRADLFAAGLILYRMLTGIVPFDGDNEFQIYNNLISKEVTPPKVLNPAVPDELNRIVMKMLERDPDRRFQDGYAVKSELERVLHQIAPGYTNSRLSRYIEKVVNEEEIYEDELKTTVLESGPHPFGPTETPAFHSPGTGQMPGSHQSTDFQDTVNESTDLAEQERLRAQFRAQQSGAGSGSGLSSGFQQLGGVGSSPSQVPEFQSPPSSPSSSQPADIRQQTESQPPAEQSQQPRANGPSSTMPPLPDAPQRASAPAMATGKFGAASTPVPSKKSSKLLPIVGIVMTLLVIGGLLGYSVVQEQKNDEEASRDGSAAVVPEESLETPDPETSETEILEPETDEVGELVLEADSDGDEDAVEPRDPAPIEAGEEVSLRIDSDPPGATVVLDGVEMGTTPFSMKTYPSEEPSKVELELDDYKPHTMEIVLDESMEKTIELERERRRRPRKTRSNRPSRSSSSSSSSDDGDLVIPMLGEDSNDKKGPAKKPKKEEKDDDIIDPFEL